MLDKLQPHTQSSILQFLDSCYKQHSDNFEHLLMWRKRSIPTHSGWLYPLTFDAEKGLKEA